MHTLERKRATRLACCMALAVCSCGERLALYDDYGAPTVPEQTKTEVEVTRHAPSDDSANAIASFAVTTYNILAKSLGSNSIPWVMTASPDVVEQVEKATGKAWKDWKAQQVFSQYKQHFHKNLKLGADKISAMRGLWATQKLESEEDIPNALKDVVTFQEKDCVSYEGQDHVCTLRGLLREKLNESLGVALFEDLMKQESEVYSWATRGPRLFQTIAFEKQLLPEAEGIAEGMVSNIASDIVAIQEYDVYEVEADYWGKGTQETFPAAMAAAGFAHILFKDPFADKTPKSGIGLFWRTSKFELWSCHGADGCNGGVQDLACGENNESVNNVDLMEQYHPTNGDGIAAQRMAVADRRNAAFLKLRHLGSNKPLWVVTSHLMTTSRDNPRTNKFPGEVRAGELKALRDQAQTLVPPGEALVLVGDFNIGAHDIGQIFSGHFVDPKDGKTFEVETGFDYEHRALVWSEGALVLREAFESRHPWSHDEGTGSSAIPDQCTSFNNDRAEWIDYVWYSAASLRPLALSNSTCPQSQMPDRTHGSDHMPLTVLFEFGA